MTIPRARTADEMSAALMDYLIFTARYWATMDRLDAKGNRIKEPIDDAAIADRLYRLTGFLHSVIVAFDGCAGGLPFGVELRTAGDPSNETFHREQGEDWYPNDVVLDGLRGLWSRANKEP